VKVSFSGKSPYTVNQIVCFAPVDVDLITVRLVRIQNREGFMDNNIHDQVAAINAIFILHINDNAHIIQLNIYLLYHNIGNVFTCWW
jgi:hypothetical protein